MSQSLEALFELFVDPKRDTFMGLLEGVCPMLSMYIPLI
jgi:hypothetical protein